MGDDVHVNLAELKVLRGRIAAITGNIDRKAVCDHIGTYVSEMVKDHLDVMAPSHHKVADRLGATHTRYLEYASGRVGGVREDGSKPGVEAKDNTGDSITISIKNTPGLARAFGPITVVPKNKRALTIPVSRFSYGKRVSKLESEGHRIFRITSHTGRGLLVENDGTDRMVGGKRQKGIRPLYCLVKRAVLPEDKGLLPSKADYSNWAKDAVDGYIAKMAL